MLNLDFNLSSQEERKVYIENLLKTYKPSKKELETIGDYLLYGYDEDGENAVSRGELQIGTKYGSYRKKRPESLEAILEGEHQPTLRDFSTLYRVPKRPPIGDEEAATIPGLRELRQIIGEQERFLVELEKDLAVLLEGKQDPPPGKEKDAKKLLYRIHKLRHHIISLRQDQYAIRREHKPLICGRPTTATFAEEETIEWGIGVKVGPLGIAGEGPTEESPLIDFTNPIHVAEIYLSFRGLEEEARDLQTSNVDQLLDLLLKYERKARLSPIKKVIAAERRSGKTNSEIQAACVAAGKNYSYNYVSTLWRKICGEVAEAAKHSLLEYRERFNTYNWKVCSKCGEPRLKSLKEFTRKASSSDGLGSICRACRLKK